VSVKELSRVEHSWGDPRQEPRARAVSARANFYFLILFFSSLFPVLQFMFENCLSALDKSGAPAIPRKSDVSSKEGFAFKTCRTLQAQGLIDVLEIHTEKGRDGFEFRG